MKVLALDCTFGGHSVALLSNDRENPVARHMPKIHASEGIIDSIDKVLAKAGISLDDVTSLASGIGPGNFSGIRSACCVAQGLAFVKGIKIALVHSTLALAQASGCENAFVGYPAHRGHCYLAAYARTGEKWKVRLAPSLFSLDRLPRFEGNWELCSRRMSPHRARLEKCVSGNLEGSPSWRGSLAPAVAQIGMRMAVDGQLVDPADALPLYVRNKVALTIAERKAGEAS